MSSPTEGPRIAFITSDNHGGLVTIAAAATLSYMLLCFFVRIYIRFVVSRRFGRDDGTLAFATATGLGQSVVVLISVGEGFGKSLRLLDYSHFLQVEKAVYASDILFLVTLCLSKCSVVFLLAGLTRSKNHSLACKIILGLSATWGVASVLAIALRCQLSHPWVTVDAQCTNLYLRWQLVGAFDIITEAALVAMAVYLVWNLQMSMKMKAIVVTAFTFRLPLILLASLRLHYLATAIGSPNPTFVGVPASILTQVEMNYSLISATIPCLKPFMRACNTGFLGGPLTKQHGSTYTSAGSYALQSVSSDKTAVTSHRQTSTRKILRPGRGDTMTVIAHEPRRAGREDDDSVDSGGSQQMIIRQTRGWTVEHDTERQGDLASRYPAGHMSS